MFVVNLNCMGAEAQSSPSSSPSATLSWSDLSKMPLPSERAARVPYGEGPQQFGELRVPKGEGLSGHGADPWRLLAECVRLCLHHASGWVVTERGVATWTIEYRRLGDEGGGWPGTFLDVARAADKLRDIAPTSKLDLERVYSGGHSAGGHWRSGSRHARSSRRRANFS
jgi:hypothetical protein